MEKTKKRKLQLDKQRETLSDAQKQLPPNSQLHMLYNARKPISKVTDKVAKAKKWLEQLSLLTESTQQGDSLVPYVSQFIYDNVEIVMDYLMKEGLEKYV